MTRSHLRWTAVLGCVAVVLAASLVAAPSSQAVNGVWTIAPITIPPNTPEPGLSDVSCVTANWCMAVSGTVFAHWNGSAWSVAQPPDVPNVIDSLYVQSVSCTSTSWCVAVGDEIGPTDATDHVVIDAWNGTAWAPMTAPALQPQFGSLNSVSCTSSTFCIALGDVVDAQHPADGVLDAWDGATWTIHDLPLVSDSGALSKVSCAGPAFCLIVGSTEANPFGPFTPFAYRWNGTALTPVSAPPGPVEPGAISCLSPTHCTSVGINGITLIDDRWNGSTWTAHFMPNPGGADVISALSCASAVSCDVVGTKNLVSLGNNQSAVPLIERYNGYGWTVVGGPGLRSESSLTGVSCLSATACVAVGSASTGSFDYQSLVETTYQVASAHATAVTVTSTQQDILPGGTVTFTAKVTGSDGGGTLTFWRRVDYPGEALPGCVGEPLTKVGAAYQATCTATADANDDVGAEVQYSGSGDYAPSIGVDNVFVIYGDPTVEQLPDAPGFASYHRALTTSGYWSWSLIGGTMPPGLKVSTTGVIYGTPTVPGTFTFDVHGAPFENTANDILDQFTIRITPLTVRPVSPVPYALDQPVNLHLAATGGKSTLTWSLTSGSLPPGVKLASTGALSGAITVPGTYSFVVGVQDSSTPTPQTATAAVVLTALPLSVSTAAANGQVGKAYAVHFATVGGKSPFTWSITAGSLPPGLTFTPAGYLSGKPTTTGSFAFTVRVADSASPANTATRSETVVVS